MARVVFFHHAQGLTAGCLSLARRLGAGDHRVHTPDLYDGRTFSELPAGIASAEEVGFDTILERGRAGAEELPAQVHMMGADPLVTDVGDLAFAEDMVASLASAGLHLHPGDGHLFVDVSLPDDEPTAADLVVERVLGLLADIDGSERA